MAPMLERSVRCDPCEGRILTVLKHYIYLPRLSWCCLLMQTERKWRSVEIRLPNSLEAKTRKEEREKERKKEGKTERKKNKKETAWSYFSSQSKGICVSCLN